MPRSLRIACKRCSSSSTMSGARPCESSSTSSSSGAQASAEPIASIWRSPPERYPASRSRRRASTGKYSQTASASLRASAPGRGTTASMFSTTVRFSKTLLRSGTSVIPREVIRCGGRFSMRWPRYSIDPSVTRASSTPRNPEIARSVVVLPAPLVPSSATIEPSGTSSEIPCTAVMTW